MKPSITVEQRRARLAVRHRVAPAHRADRLVDVSGDLVGLHATDPASVYLAAWARLSAPDPHDIATALYEDRSVVRMLGMRRTVFVVPVDLMPAVHAACTLPIAERERRRVLAAIERTEPVVTDDAAGWLADIEEATVEALTELGEATAGELSERLPLLRTKVELGTGTRWQTLQAVCPRVLFLLAAQGRVVRGRPRGTWVSTLYGWVPMQAWVPGGMPHMGEREARAEVARRWLAAYGPATLADLKWWTGWTVRDARSALADVGAVEVDLAGADGFVLADDLDDVDAGDPWVALLPALDPTTMGWSEREWYLGDHRPRLFDRNGNAGPTVWSDGRVVGGWAQRADGEIAWHLLTDVGATVEAAVADEAGRLRAWLGDRRFVPRFRTPLERELSA